MNYVEVQQMRKQAAIKDLVKGFMSKFKGKKTAPKSSSTVSKGKPSPVRKGGAGFGIPTSPKDIKPSNESKRNGSVTRKGGAGFGMIEDKPYKD